MAAVLDSAGAEDLASQKMAVKATKFLLAEVGTISQAKLTEKRLSKGLVPLGFSDGQVKIVLAAMQWKHSKLTAQQADQDEVQPSAASLRLSESLFDVGDDPFRFVQLEYAELCSIPDTKMSGPVTARAHASASSLWMLITSL